MSRNSCNQPSVSSACSGVHGVVFHSVMTSVTLFKISCIRSPSFIMPSAMTFSKNALSSADMGAGVSSRVPSAYERLHFKRPSHANGFLLLPPPALVAEEDI
eukprot:scaffold1353_cov161-Amphora_coffeaeformis.AAC.45